MSGKFSAPNSETPGLRGFAVLGVARTFEPGASGTREHSAGKGSPVEFSALNFPDPGVRIGGSCPRNLGAGPEGWPPGRRRGSGPPGKFSALNFVTPDLRGFAFLEVGKGVGLGVSGAGRRSLEAGPARKFSALNFPDSVQPGRGEMPFHASQ